MTVVLEHILVPAHDAISPLRARHVDGSRRRTGRHGVRRLIGRLFAGEAGAVMMTELRGASSAKAKRELRWRPAHPSWRGGFQAV